MIRIVRWVFIIGLSITALSTYCQVKLPVRASHLTIVEQIQLSEIGQYGIVRKARPGVPEHLHSGVDITRPVNNYNNVPIYAINDGIVISIREDGPYAQLIMARD